MLLISDRDVFALKRQAFFPMLFVLGKQHNSVTPPALIAARRRHGVEFVEESSS
jgi:hypothetical protein